MLATVARYYDPWEAHILRARLEAEGIPARVVGDQHIIANWPMSVALGGAALQVPASCLAQAQQVIAAYQAGVYEKDLVEAHPEALDACPACGSAEITRSVPARSKVLNIATLLLAFAPFPARASRMRCRACGHRWHYDG